MSSAEPDRLTLGFPHGTVRQFGDARFVVAVHLDENRGVICVRNDYDDALFVRDSLLTNPNYLRELARAEAHK